ncbi:TrkH family potassium uptake protein [Diaphorobacter aerolatus]|uniref:Trk system potassium uptake protein n=1 Tax=Diaphorobacter aerolatus TaxID=1288495 RepID=A0A7H0GH29_9BURK|nr:potassium transporter TrkG [Diaphorobacter aerolatus]QNP47595.1 TrkH family potassium uptake protein [Diaphorobacter aerolatus]
MSDLFPVLRLMCALLAMFAGALLVPLIASFYADDGLWKCYVASILFTLLVSAILWFSTRRFQRELLPRHGVMLVSMVWVVLPLFAAIPLLLVSYEINQPMSFTHAYFEAVSGLTTTGSSVLSNLDQLPLSLNVWRTFMQWLGGMGILILAVAVLPLLGVGASQLFKAEAAGPVKDTKLTPRMTETAKGLWGVYVLFSLFCALGYWWAGMTPEDAIMHMFSTVSLGGLSPHDASFAYFKSPLMELIAIFFMMAASCNFALYFIALRKGNWHGFWRDVEMRATMATLVGGGLLVALLLWAKDVYAPLEALRMGMFHVVSVATTTGYTTTDYLGWPVFAPVFMIMLSGVATGAGSTGGGIKMARMLILVKQAKREMARIIHPSAVQPVKLGNAVVDNRMIFSVLAFMLMYGATVIVLSMALLLTDLDPVTAFSAVLASVHCAGSAMGRLGPSSSYIILTDFQLWVCTLGMLLGRLEILSFIALLTPTFWRR